MISSPAYEHAYTSSLEANRLACLKSLTALEMTQLSGQNFSRLSGQRLAFMYGDGAAVSGLLRGTGAMDMGNHDDLQSVS